MPVASTYSESPSTFEKRSTRTCWGRVWYHFSTQTTRGHPTIFNLAFSISIFLLLSLAYLIGGGILLTISLRQVQIKATYSDVGALGPLTDDERAAVLSYRSQSVKGVALDPNTMAINSPLEVEVMEDMSGPIHIYYVLNSWYQNHKRYVRSVNYDQLHGKEVSYDSLTDCIPLRSIQNDTLPDEGVINPCGLTAWSYFNDTFTDFKVSRVDAPGSFAPLPVDESNLVWDSDRNTFFGNYTAVNFNLDLNETTQQELGIPGYQRGGQTLTLNVSSDEHFMRWMRPSAHPTVRKYYGVINEDLHKGDKVQFTVYNRFNTYDFGGSKQLMLTTQGPFGNRNLTFGLVWLVMGVLCGIITVTFLLIGWKQLWNKDERRAFLQERWARGNVHGPSRCTMGSHDD